MDLYEYLKKTFKHYKYPNWHHELICSHYQMLIERKIKRLMIMLPVCHMATTLTNTALSYALEKNMNEVAFNATYRKAMAEKNAQEIKKNSGENNKIFSQSVDGPLTGESFSICAIDNPISTVLEANSTVIQERMINGYRNIENHVESENSAISIISNRMVGDDLIGRLLQEDGMKSYNGHKPSKGVHEWNGKDSGDWTVLCLPLIMDKEAFKFKHKEDPRGVDDLLWPKKFGKEWSDHLGERRFDFQQRPK